MAHWLSYNHKVKNKSHFKTPLFFFMMPFDNLTKLFHMSHRKFVDLPTKDGGFFHGLSLWIHIHCLRRYGYHPPHDRVYYTPVSLPKKVRLDPKGMEALLEFTISLWSEVTDLVN